jgi:DNA-binding XRE family transcriptional regulator
MHDQQVPEGQRRYEEYWARQMADPEFRAVYEAEAARKALWLQLVEARQALGLTQDDVASRLGVSRAQVARIENHGYDSCSLSTLRRYLAALDAGYTLEVAVRAPTPAARPKRAAVGR